MTETNEKVCKVEYINKIAQNLRRIKKEQLKKLLRASKSCRRMILVGEGRSGYALLIGIKGSNKHTFHEDDSSWHWSNPVEAMKEFEQKRSKTLILINSGSGTTTSPKETAMELRDFINDAKETRSQKIIIATVTSHREATIAQMSDVVLELKGREDGKEESSPLESGIIGDQFELASMVLFRMLKEAINKNLSAEEVMIRIEKEMKILGKLIDDYLASHHYSELIKEAASRERIVIGGRGPDKKVGEITIIRLLHLNRMVNREAWPTGPLVPPPKLGDILVPISFSGETKSTLEWVSTYKKAGGIIFPIVGTANSTLSKENGYVIEGSREDFYVRTVFILSPLAGGMMEAFRTHGTEIPEKMIRVLCHSKTE